MLFPVRVHTTKLILTFSIFKLPNRMNRDTFSLGIGHKLLFVHIALKHYLNHFGFDKLELLLILGKKEKQQRNFTVERQ